MDMKLSVQWWSFCSGLNEFTWNENFHSESTEMYMVIDVFYPLNDWVIFFNM